MWEIKQQLTVYMSPIYTWQSEPWLDPTGPPPPGWTLTSSPQGGGLVWCRATSAGSVPHEGAAAVLLVPGEGPDSQVHIGGTGAPSSGPACVRPEQAQTEEPTWNQGSKYHWGPEGGSKEDAYIHSSTFKYFRYQILLLDYISEGNMRLFTWHLSDSYFTDFYTKTYEVGH